MNILLQGPPGIGKTTVIRRLSNFLKNPAGFYTEEIRKAGKRVGFRVKSFEGEEEILAHVNYQSSYKVGKYKVNIEGFEKIAIPALEKGLKEGKVLVIDEIGKMETFSNKFKEKIRKILDAPFPVVATIPEKTTPQIRELLEGKKYRIIKITRENRDHLPLLILNLLKSHT